MQVAGRFKFAEGRCPLGGKKRDRVHLYCRTQQSICSEIPSKRIPIAAGSTYSFRSAEAIQKRSSGNCANDRFFLQGLQREAHYPHTVRPTKQALIGVSLKGWMIGRQSARVFDL
jgi:hypothetical protein